MLADSAKKVTTWMAWVMLLLSPVVFVALVKRMSAPYGRCCLRVCLQKCDLPADVERDNTFMSCCRYSNSQWGPLMIPARVAWLVRALWHPVLQPPLRGHGWLPHTQEAPEAFSI